MCRCVFSSLNGRVCASPTCPCTQVCGGNALYLRDLTFTTASVSATGVLAVQAGQLVMQRVAFEGVAGAPAQSAGSSFVGGAAVFARSSTVLVCVYRSLSRYSLASPLCWYVCTVAYYCLIELHCAGTRVS